MGQAESAAIDGCQGFRFGNDPGIWDFQFLTIMDDLKAIPCSTNHSYKQKPLPVMFNHSVLKDTQDTII